MVSLSVLLPFCIFSCSEADVAVLWLASLSVLLPFCIFSFSEADVAVLWLASQFEMGGY